MKDLYKKILIYGAVASLSLLGVHSAKARTLPQTSVDLEQVLSWLPADTETVTVARGNFVFPAIPDWQRAEDTTVSNEELAEAFEDLPLWLFQLKHGSLSTRLKGKQVALAVEGARHFRPPAGLGEMPFDGCAIAVFSSGFDDKPEALSRETANQALRVEQIQGEQVSVFEEKLGEDRWTTFVAFPGKNVILVGTNKEYIKEVLTRFQGNVGKRAVPSNLPEWKYINNQARFWGIRNFDRTQAKTDPSSPFGGKKSANFPDEFAIGLAFEFDPSKGKSATIEYFSDDKNLQKNSSATPLAVDQAPEARGLNITIREIAPGVLEGSYTLRQLGPVGFFLFALGDMLGHGVYL